MNISFTLPLQLHLNFFLHTCLDTYQSITKNLSHLITYLRAISSPTRRRLHNLRPIPRPLNPKKHKRLNPPLHTTPIPVKYKYPFAPAFIVSVQLALGSRRNFETVQVSGWKIALELSSVFPHKSTHMNPLLDHHSAPSGLDTAQRHSLTAQNKIHCRGVELWVWSTVLSRRWC